MSLSPFSRVAVLKGGPSAEREVSLRSGAAVAAGLRQAGYKVAEIDVVAPRLELPEGIEAVFVALHGEYGEDGRVQQELVDMGIPYTGGGPDASRAAFDKRLTKRLLFTAGVPTPAYELLTAAGDRTLPLPLVVKPPCQGSTIGISRVVREADWEAGFAAAREFGEEVLVEEYIEGRELTVGLVCGETLPVVEIAAPDGWYDYGAKYTSGVTEYHVPAALTDAEAALCSDLGRRTFEALGMRGLGRVDLRLSAQGRALVLELNSIPGFTETSLLPKAAAAAGINFSELCDRIMRSAVL
jgi:D-alanine-D-alanine ligase